jgi:hypothetical protein
MQPGEAGVAPSHPRLKGGTPPLRNPVRGFRG